MKTNGKAAREILQPRMEDTDTQSIAIQEWGQTVIHLNSIK